MGGENGVVVRGSLWRLLHPPRTIWPTRDGWWCLFAVVGLGVAGINTGNNLLYLLVSMLLGLIVVSGILSEQTMRGLHLTPVVPDEIYAGRAAVFGATVGNRKRRLPSYSISIEAGTRAAPAARRPYLPRVEGGGERLVTWEETFPSRGRQRLAGVRVATRFPFGLFVKQSRIVLDSEVVVFPALYPVGAARLREIGGAGAAATRRRGRGSDLYNLRQYRSGDDPRLIHWRSSAKAQSLLVRELEAEATVDARIVLEAGATPEPGRLEEGLSEAASLAIHLLRGGAGVELSGPGVLVPLGRGRGQERLILTALALYQPVPGPAALSDEGPAAPLREIRVRLG